MQYKRSLFPLGIATGDAFLARQDECQQLINNIQKSWHTLLLSPRRYGKSSLVKNALQKSKLPFVEVDLFFVNDAISVERKIVSATQTLIQQLSPNPDHWFKDLMAFFKHTKQKWSISIKGIGIEFEPERHDNVPDTIYDSLMAVETILKKLDTTAILFLDEIQEMHTITQSKSIEGAIRHFAQEARHLCLIFSGSNQHMLKHMFDNQSRPLYALCHKLHLQRLPASIYHSYFQKVAKRTWGTVLPSEVCEAITAISECHPRVTYLLAGLVWDKFSSLKRPPKVTDVKAIWTDFVAVESRDLYAELSRLSAGQINTLTLIASDEMQKISGQKAQQALQMSGSAITQALQKLEALGYVEKLVMGAYRVIDPIIKAVLLRHNRESLR